MISRRQFLDTLAVGTAGLAVASSAKSYAQILGANDRVNFAVIGLNGRAYAHLSALKANAAKSRVTHIVDVDSRILNRYAAAVQKELGYSATTDKDFRKMLEAKDVDAITVATPEHWHTPMAVAGLQAGKHVYVEKPCSHNPHEGELLVAARDKYGKLVQMGSQQRSSPHTIAVIKRIHEGLIGRAYYGRAWYVNNRKSIGVGKVVPVPAELDWELWQGPAPRRPYKDNVHPYNWHWFKLYGTGESLNNGTHEVDVCRWALGVDYPKTVTASGGRYQFTDDWQFYDTLNTSFEYDGKMISWEGKSCQAMRVYDRERGSVIMGTDGSVLIDRDGFEVYNQAGKKVEEYRVNSVKTSSADLTGRDSMTDLHFANFIAGIQTGEKLHAPIEVGNISVTMLQLSNIAWELNHELKLDQKTGHVLNDPKASAMRFREYEKGWELKI
ncbi:MAG: Gfo/Idh/MocA family oxidoreductase [Acidobacteriota bacterium]|nr:Gfo/Idh/MocA family oxidoreductase [Acidobacteriota bacterium]